MILVLEIPGKNFFPENWFEIEMNGVIINKK